MKEKTRGNKMKKAKTVGQIVDYIQAFNNAFIKEVGYGYVKIEASNMSMLKIEDEKVVVVDAVGFRNGMNTMTISPIKKKIILKKIKETKDTITEEEIERAYQNFFTI